MKVNVKHNDNNLSPYYSICESLVKQYVNGKFTTSQVLTVIDDHLNPCMKPANKPVATRTVFTTQIWDVTGITQPLLKMAESSSEHETVLIKRMQRSPKMAEKQLRAWGHHCKKKLNSCPRRPKSSSEHGPVVE